MKVAYVTVRYGPSIVGGAEQACRQLAEHLAADGVAVEVHTTCATDSTTWAEDLPAGTTVEAGVTVHRHPSRSGRNRRFESFSTDVLADPAHQSPETESRWLELQGSGVPGGDRCGAEQRSRPDRGHPLPLLADGRAGVACRRSAGAPSGGPR